ncbi:MAG: hypothetical protein ACOY4I_16205 [Bacillota bacterium]
MEYGDAMTVFAILESIKEGRVVEVDREDQYTPDYSGYRDQPAAENSPRMQ